MFKKKEIGIFLGNLNKQTLAAYDSYLAENNPKMRKVIEKTTIANLQAAKDKLFITPKKFEEQNKTVEGVQASLDDKFNKQLIFFVLGLVLFVIIAMVATKSATAKGLKQSQSNWNQFQEHILKK
jgi:hypothetical protein